MAVTLGQKVKFLCVAGVGLFCDGFLNLTIGLGELFIAFDGQYVLVLMRDS